MVLKSRGMISVFGARVNFWVPVRAAFLCYALLTLKKMRSCLRPPALRQTNCCATTPTMPNAMCSDGLEEGVNTCGCKPADTKPLRSGSPIRSCLSTRLDSPGNNE